MKMECGLVGQIITTLYGRIQRTVRGPTHLVGLSAWEVCGDSIVDLLAPEWDTVHRPHHGKGATHKRGPESTQLNFVGVSADDSLEAMELVRLACSRSMNWRSTAARGGGPSREGLEAVPNKSHLFIRLCLFDYQVSKRHHLPPNDPPPLARHLKYSTRHHPPPAHLATTTTTTTTTNIPPTRTPTTSQKHVVSTLHLVDLAGGSDEGEGGVPPRFDSLAVHEDGVKKHTTRSLSALQKVTSELALASLPSLPSSIYPIPQNRTTPRLKCSDTKASNPPTLPS